MLSDKLAVCSVVPVGTGAIGVETLSAAAAVHGEYLILRPCTISRIMFAVTLTVAASSTAPVVTIRRRLAQGVTSGQTTIGTLTVPDLTAAGKVLYKDVAPVKLNVGDTICMDHTTQAVDGSAAAGAGYYGFVLEDSPDAAGSQGDMVKSA